MPTGLAANSLYYVVNTSTNTFQLSLSENGAAETISDSGFGSHQVWRANTGFDDPIQGRPEFFPLLNLTFSNICYVEGKLPTNLSADEEPDGFQFGIRGRRIADIDSIGEITAVDFSANNPRVYADILLNDIKRPVSRLHLPSFSEFKLSCDAMICHHASADTSAPGIGLTGK